MRIEEKGAVLACLDWIGDKVPEPQSVENCTVLRLSQGPFEGQAATYWEAEEQVVDGIEYIGPSSPSAEEIKLTTCQCKGKHVHVNVLWGDGKPARQT